jgi:hydroxymethylbilane synthase
MLTVKGGIISLDGHRVVKIKKSGRPDDHKEIGEAVANEVLQSGGQQILDEIRKQLV